MRHMRTTRVQEGETMVVPAPGANGAICWCRQMSSGTSICPACAEQQLLALLSTTPNTPLSSEERVALSEVVSGGWRTCRRPCCRRAVSPYLIKRQSQRQVVRQRYHPI